MMSRCVYIVGPATCSPSKADLGAEEAKRKERKGKRGTRMICGGRQLLSRTDSIP
jgi:hypothetical protein